MKKLLCIFLLVLIAATTNGDRFLRGESFGQRYGIDPTGLVLWLDQSDPRSYGDVGNWYDLSGNGNHGSQAVGGSQPAIVGVDGLAGSARQYDGSADHILVADNASLDLTDEITVSVWINLIDSNDDVIVAKRDDANYAWELVVSTDASGNKLLANINANANNATSSASISENVWTHVGMTYDKDAGGTEEIKAYINGAVDGTGDYAVAISTNNVDVSVGRRLHSSPAYSEGFVDSVFIFDRALTAAEIQRLYLADVQQHGGL